jgi:peroxiredoxin
VKRLVGGVFLLVQALAVPVDADASHLSALLPALDLGGYARDERPPDFVGLTATGPALSLAELHGKVVLLTFWATWCPPCGPELEVLESLHRELGVQRLAIVAVNASESMPVVLEYARARGLTFPVLVDPRGDIQRAYGVLGLPTTFVIARDGRAVARAIGARDWGGNRFRELLQELLHEPALPRAPAGTGRP